MIVQCNEKGFTPENVRAICSIGKSTKMGNSGYIGRSHATFALECPRLRAFPQERKESVRFNFNLSAFRPNLLRLVGFKSVFTVADVVWVLSYPYTFKFDKRQPLGMIAPIATNERAPSLGWTSLVLDLSPLIQRQELVKRLQDISPSLLLFLRKLRRVDVKIDGRVMQLEMTTTGDGITQLKRSAGPAVRISNYMLFEYTLPAYGHDEKRPHITQSEIVIAFPVTQDVEPVEREQEVHAFLPLRNYGFRVGRP